MKDGAAQAVGPVILRGLRQQVGAVYRTHESGRDSSRENFIGPGDSEHRRTQQRPSNL